MSDFRSRMKTATIRYKEEVLSLRKPGNWRGGKYRHILPIEVWDLNLWEQIRDAARIHFVEEEIAWHAQRHNLLSSQILCVNIFFPLRNEQTLLAGFLANHIPQLAGVGKMYFEYIGDKNYLNEPGGRGQLRTSADVALEWFDTSNSRGLLLLEFKFTEREFGGCGGATSKGNADRLRCHRPTEIVEAPDRMCYLAKPKERPYWQIALGPDSPLRIDLLTKEPYCPFRYDFYQLMRNQFLAHMIESDPHSGFRRALFGVAYHAENDNLLQMDRTFDGEGNPLKAWAGLLREPDSFINLTLQDLLTWMDPRLPSHLEGWRSFLSEKYEL
ncbi:MAG: hypothetical protein MUP04_01885 [Anaerolineae bacterium]|nr:hypothetical protein [Anaerolineae bacterium]